MPKIVQLNEEIKKQLSQEVNETLADNVNKVNNNKTKFTAVDLWNRQRQSRSTRTMMRPWEMN
ncbi:MAG: hypothetical protein ABIU11_07990 [Chitinophagaceae bacterium]